MQVFGKQKNLQTYSHLFHKLSALETSAEGLQRKTHIQFCTVSLLIVSTSLTSALSDWDTGHIWDVMKDSHDSCSGVQVILPNRQCAGANLLFFLMYYENSITCHQNCFASDNNQGCWEQTLLSDLHYSRWGHNIGLSFLLKTSKLLWVSCTASLSLCDLLLWDQLCRTRPSFQNGKRRRSCRTCVNPKCLILSTTFMNVC